MNRRQRARDALPRVGKLCAAIIIGISIGTLAQAEPVTLPAVGTVSGLLAGGSGIAIGTLLFTRIPGASRCGCSGECGC